MVTNQTNGMSSNTQESASDQVKQLKQKAVEKVSSTVDTANEKAAETYEQMKKVLAEAGHTIQEQSEELYDAIAKYVRENPLKAVGIAVLAGGFLAVMAKKMCD